MKGDFGHGQRCKPSLFFKINTDYKIIIHLWYSNIYKNIFKLSLLIVATNEFILIVFDTSPRKKERM